MRLQNRTLSKDFLAPYDSCSGVRGFFTYDSCSFSLYVVASKVSLYFGHYRSRIFALFSDIFANGMNRMVDLVPQFPE